MNNLKIALLGGGSLYFESCMAEIASTPELANTELVLYDIDEARMDLIRRIGLRIVEKTQAKLSIRATTDLKDALDGAHFVIASIGVHGPGHVWHKTDSDVAAKFGIIHTTGDTVGPAGLSQGLRIIPIFVDVARKMEKYCPDAILMNHSNPMSPICRAVTKYSSIKAIGYCHNVQADIRRFARLLEIDAKELDVSAAGPNHCVWLLDIKHKGKDMYPELKKRLLTEADKKGHRFTQELLDLFGLYVIGGDRHIIEFFPHSRKATDTKDIHYELKWRSDMICEKALARELSTDPQDVELKAEGKKDVWLPDKPTPEAMGLQIKTMAFGGEMDHYVNIPNNGAISNLPDWAVIETNALVSKGGASALPGPDLPAQAARWSLAQLYAHELTISAAVEGSREKALMALASDPMMRDFDEAKNVFDAIVDGQNGRLDQFRA